MKNRIQRYGILVRLEHWTVALSGIALIFTGLGCLPLFKRYYITELPGFGWTTDFYTVTKIHYIAAIFFVMGVLFHLFYHGLRKDFGLIPRPRDFIDSFKVILASFGIGKEPPCDKWLPEQRVAYLFIGLNILVVGGTGFLKVLKNLEWVIFSPKTETLLNLTHTISGGIFILMFIIHVFFVLAVKSNWPLLKAMITGYVDEEYVKKRHHLWYEKIKGEVNLEE